MGFSPRAIQKRLSRLDQLGLVQRVERRDGKGTKGSQSSTFKFTGLIEKATPFAIEATQERERIEQMKRDQLRRKGVRLETPHEEEPS